MKKEIADIAKSLTKEECEKVLSEIKVIRNDNGRKVGEIK